MIALFSRTPYDGVTQWVDKRIRSMSLKAEKPLTKVTVAVYVGAMLFWVITDAQRPVIEVEQYLPTIGWAAQTTLRDVIGKSEQGGHWRPMKPGPRVGSRRMK